VVVQWLNQALYFYQSLSFEHESQKEGVIEPLPSQLKEVYTRYLSVIEEGELDIVQGEWIVKRRNCVATLNNKGSRTTLYIIDVEGFCFK
jgi:hypothetical protein